VYDSYTAFGIRVFFVYIISEKKGLGQMETRIGLIGIIVEDLNATEKLNQILHDYGSYIIGRMGIPYHEKQMSIISVVMDAPQEKVSALSGKLGMIPGVSSKCLYAPDTQKTLK